MSFCEIIKNHTQPLIPFFEPLIQPLIQTLMPKIIGFHPKHAPQSHASHDVNQCFRIRTILNEVCCQEGLQHCPKISCRSVAPNLQQMTSVSRPHLENQWEAVQHMATTLKNQEISSKATTHNQSN